MQSQKAVGLFVYAAFHLPQLQLPVKAFSFHNGNHSPVPLTYHTSRRSGTVMQSEHVHTGRVKPEAKQGHGILSLRLGLVKCTEGTVVEVWVVIPQVIGIVAWIVDTVDAPQHYLAVAETGYWVGDALQGRGVR